MTRDDNDDNDAEAQRHKQILVGGIDKEQHHDDTKTMLKQLVTQLLGNRPRVEIGTLLDKPGSLGTLTFPTVNDKINFYKKLNQQNEHGQELSFFNNLTFSERTREKHLGLVKHFMMRSGDYSAGDVKIVWPRKLVTLKGRKVAWFNDSQEMQMTKAAKQHDAEIKAALKEWVDKRSRKDPETDSD